MNHNLPLKQFKLRLFNSLEGKFSELTLQPYQTINIYLCGPTVYGPVHIGNLRPTILFDLLHRLLLSLKVKVNYIQNITDIDDKIITRARQEGKSEKELSSHYTRAYLNNLVNYNILLPAALPRVTNFIPAIQKFIICLEKKGTAYLQSGEVFFRVSQNPEYGKLSRQNLTKLKEGTREIIQSNKENSRDFVLWKKTTTGLVWDSLWGKGRPGWHTECAVFVQEFFGGQTIEIHGGGNDLLFPHHENERIQYLALHNRELSKIWLHVAHLHWQEQKMSKSLGNVILAKHFAQKYGVNVFRYLILSSSYKQVINFNEKLIQQATNYVQKIKNLFKRLNFYLYTKKIKVKNSSNLLPQAVVDCLLNDLNTAQTLFFLEEVMVLLNKSITNKVNSQEFQKTIANFYAILEVLGFRFYLPVYDFKTRLLISQWQRLLREKKYFLADQIRHQLIKNDII